MKEISAMAVEYSKKNTNISPLSSDSRTYESRILAGVTDNAYADGKFLESLPYGGIYSAPTWDLLERTSIIPLGKTF